MLRVPSACLVLTVLLAVSAPVGCADEEVAADLRALSSPRISTVRAAQDRLRARADEALPHLITMLRAADPIDRRIAALTLGNFGKEAADAVNELRAALRDENFPVRLAAIDALSGVGHAASSAREDLEGLRDAAWWSLRNPFRPAEGYHAQRAAAEAAAAESAQRRIKGGSPLDEAEDPLVEGLPVSAWVRRLEGPWTVGTLDREGSDEAARVLATVAPAAVLPHLLARLRGALLRVLFSPTGSLRHDFAEREEVRTGSRIARQAPEAFAAALSWAMEEEDPALTYVCLTLARQGGLDPALYESALTKLFAAHSGWGTRPLQKETRELAVRMAPREGPGGRALLGHYRWVLRHATQYSRIQVLIDIGSFRDDAKGFLDEIREVLAAEDEATRNMLSDVFFLSDEAWVTSRDMLTAVTLQIEHGADAPFEALRSDRVTLRRIGVACITGSWLEEERGLTALADALGDADEGVRQLAAWRLLEAGPSGVEMLRKRAAADEEVLMEALSVAARSARTHVGPGGETTYAHGHVPHDLGEDAIRLDTSLLLDLAIRALDAPDADVRGLAARALGGMGPAAAKAEVLLRAHLNDAESDVRSNVAEALGFVSKGGTDTVKALGALLAEEQPSHVQTAAHALARLPHGGADSLPGILDALRRAKDLVSHREIASAVVVIVEANPDLQTAVIEALPGLPDGARAALANCLGELSAASDALVEALVGRFADEGDSWRVRCGAARAIVQLAQTGHDVVPAVAVALEEGEPRARTMAAEVLGRIGYPARGEVPALRSASKGTNHDLRGAAGSALRRIQREPHRVPNADRDPPLPRLSGNRDC